MNGNISQWAVRPGYGQDQKAKDRSSGRGVRGGAGAGRGGEEENRRRGDRTGGRGDKGGPDGRSQDFACELVLRQAGLAVLRFILPHANRIGPLDLPAGGLTYGFFWEGRPYNLYWWLTPAGETLGYYFNLGDRPTIGPHDLFWRDLWVDILVVPGLDPIVLDEEEVPLDIAPALAGYLAEAKTTVLRDWPAVVAEAGEIMVAFSHFSGSSSM